MGFNHFSLRLMLLHYSLISVINRKHLRCPVYGFSTRIESLNYDDTKRTNISHPNQKALCRHHIAIKWIVSISFLTFILQHSVAYTMHNERRWKIGWGLERKKCRTTAKCVLHANKVIKKRKIWPQINYGCKEKWSNVSCQVIRCSFFLYLSTVGD